MGMYSLQGTAMFVCDPKLWILQLGLWDVIRLEVFAICLFVRSLFPRSKQTLDSLSCFRQKFRTTLRAFIACIA